MLGDLSCDFSRPIASWKWPWRSRPMWRQRCQVGKSAVFWMEQERHLVTICGSGQRASTGGTKDSCYSGHFRGTVAVKWCFSVTQVSDLSTSETGHGCSSAKFTILPVANAAKKTEIKDSSLTRHFVSCFSSYFASSIICCCCHRFRKVSCAQVCE